MSRFGVTLKLTSMLLPLIAATGCMTLKSKGGWGKTPFVAAYRRFADVRLAPR